VNPHKHLRNRFDASARKSGHEARKFSHGPGGSAPPPAPPIVEEKKAIPAAAPANDDKPAKPKKTGLPRWDLGHMYPGLDSAELQAEKEELEARATQFKKDYEDSVAYLTGPDLGAAVAEYEEIQKVLGKINCYVILMESDSLGNFAKTAALKKWQEETAGIAGFFENELCNMKERDLMTKLSAPELAPYGPWIARVRTGTSSIDGDVDSLSNDFQSVNRESWRRLYYETLSGMRVELDGKHLTMDEAWEVMTDDALSLEKRATMRDEIADVLQANAKRMALIYNTIVKDNLTDTEIRGHGRPDHGENVANAVTDEIVDTMADTVKASYSKISHRFYAWKAKQHGVEVMERAQLGMPIPGEPAEDKDYEFADAKKIILSSFRKFSAKFERIARKFFDENYIDAEPRPDKETGAFSLATGPGNHPYIGMTYTGSLGDLVTLGHELGHGVHQVLAEKKRGLFLSEMSTTVSETASIFAEMLVFEQMLNAEKDPARKKQLLMEKTEGMMLNGLQQLSYYDFEMKVHEARKKGELDAEQISDIWVQTQKDYFGPAVKMDKLDRYYWMQVPHFFDSPFYVYSYSFAQILVSGLYQVYKGAEKEGQAAKEEFVENYIGLLETGITRNFYEMFQPFGLDPETPEFWQNGLSLMDKYMTELEKMDDKPQAKPAAKPRAPKR
jgi:oligoendopeptidase F